MQIFTQWHHPKSTHCSTLMAPKSSIYISSVTLVDIKRTLTSHGQRASVRRPIKGDGFLFKHSEEIVTSSTLMAPKSSGTLNVYCG